MKKIFIFSLFASFSVGLLAQSYPIPGAAQQPAWVFPFFLEDAHGNKDTLYIGYDSLASQCFCAGDDLAFGELWFNLDSVNFHAFTYENIVSAVKVNILPDLGPNSFYFTVGAWNAYYPIKFSWIVSLLRSDSIPFPDQYPLPRAQINLEWFSGVNSLHTATCGSNPIVITDTAQATCLCQYRDSIVIYNHFNDTNRVDMAVAIQVAQWSGRNLVGFKEINNEDRTIVFPVPANDFLFVKEYQPNFNFEILDAKGIILKEGYISNNIKRKILVSDIASGFYIIRIFDENKVVNKKIIIQH